MKIERKIREEITGSLKVTGITLLSVEEYEEAKTHIIPIKGWWWLRSPGNHSCLAALVNRGRVSTFGNRVNSTLGVVRPALLIQNLNSFKLKHGDRILDYAEHDWTVISDTMALCDDGIGTHCFHGDCEAPDANDYEQSDVKKSLETWAAEKGIICEKKMEEQDADGT